VAAGRSAAERHGWLELWEGEKLAARVELGEGRMRIGRDPCCELTTNVEGVSRVHAFVEKDRNHDRDWVLEDFESANGVYWKDRRIQRISLRDGDVVQLGSPLRGAPRLQYYQPRNVWEQVLLGFGLCSLVGSVVVVSGLMLFSTVGGGSRVDFIGGPVKIVTKQGQRVDEQEGAATALPSLEDYPLHLRQALMASEDARFGWNSGLDIGGTLRSLVRRSGGGSGITQQVARIYYPWVKRGNPESPWPWVRIPEPDLNERFASKVEIFARKLRELPVSWQLETKFNKNQIIKMYLDRAFLGMGTEGFEQASQLYFRKSARQLNLPDAAYLVGLLPSPNGYNVCLAPKKYEVRAQREERQKKLGITIAPYPDETTWTPVLRRNLVLGRMLAEGYISGEQYRDAIRHPLNIDLSICRHSSYQSYPFFSNYALEELAGPRYSLNLLQQREGGNYYAVATINPALQALAESSVKRFLETEAEPIGVNQAALISLDFKTGEILAYVGGKKYGYKTDRGETSYDRVRALRQPGSTFKLFTYLAALEDGIKPEDQISCSRIFQLEVGCRQGGASLSMSQGLALSENPIALHLADKTGFDHVIRMARKLGITTRLEPNPSMILGGNETLLYEMAQAFAIVANGGRAVVLKGVNRTYDLTICGSEQALSQCPPHGVFTPISQKKQELLSPAVAKSMDAMLLRAVQEGTGRNASVVSDARGKTGTTNNGRDAWFIGYSPSSGLLTGIWMGNDDNRPAEAAAGALAARLWGQYMSRI
jgi:peptidoglycan glycosyltransferase